MNNSDNTIAKYKCDCACINKLFQDDKEHKYTSFFDLESAIRELVHPENCEFQIKIKDKLDRQSLIYPNGFHEAPHVAKWRNDSIVLSQKLQESIKPWNHEEIKIYYGAYYYWKKLVGLVEMGTLPPRPIVESPFTVLEWATIFYYADETKLLTESRLIKTRLEQFMSKHQIKTEFNSFKNKYYEAKRRINEKNDYPINKLELIIPFLKENYKQTVTKVENDIIFLKENNPDY